jgi:broad specificity polyphosphatase/5'/3'-nucleotidase SurE
LEEKKKQKHAGKVKVEFSTSSILKKIFDKDNFEKKHVGNCNNPQCFKEKNYEVKSTKTTLEKKEKKFIKKTKKNHVGKHYSNS